MTFRLPAEKPCAPNSASAASITAARRSGSRRAHVTVGTGTSSRQYDQWSYYCERRHSQECLGVWVPSGTGAPGFPTSRKYIEVDESVRSTVDPWRRQRPGKPESG